jgi:hypothetical protein
MIVQADYGLEVCGFPLREYCRGNPDLDRFGQGIQYLAAEQTRVLYFLTGLYLVA